MGYKFNSLAGFHALNTSMFELSKAYKERGMAGYSELQEENLHYNTRIQSRKTPRFCRDSYFDAVQNTVTIGKSSTTAMKDSTETAQF
jgi:isocitrate lyase